MALIKCPECGKEISDIAPACIHCGFPLSELKNNSYVDVTKTPSNNTITTSKASDVSKENEERFPVLSENDITLNDTMNYSITAKGANLGANRAGLVNYLIENKGISFDEAFYVSGKPYCIENNLSSNQAKKLAVELHNLGAVIEIKDSYDNTVFSNEIKPKVKDDVDSHLLSTSRYDPYSIHESFRNKEKPAVKCIYCGSTDCHKPYAKGLRTLLFGLENPALGKQWYCNKCGSYF